MKIFKEPDWFYGGTSKRTKALGARFFDQFFWFFEIYSYVMSENQSFDFLKIVGQGSIISRACLLVLSSKKREDKTKFYFGKKKFQIGKSSGF